MKTAKSLLHSLCLLKKIDNQIQNKEKSNAESKIKEILMKSNTALKYCISSNTMPLYKEEGLKVYQGKIQTSNQQVAVIQIEKTATTHMKDCKDEISVIPKLAHIGNSPFIIPIEWVYEGEYFYVIVPIYSHKSLNDYLKQNQFKSEEDALNCFREVCRAFKILVDNNIVWPSLSADNILITKDGDTGYQIMVFLSKFSVFRKNAENFQIKAQPSDETNNMVYILGSLLFQILTQKELGQCNSYQIYCTWPISQFALSILEGCLLENDSQRATMDELANEMQISSEKLQYTHGMASDLSINVHKKGCIKLSQPMSNEEMKIEQLMQDNQELKETVEKQDVVIKQQKQLLEKVKSLMQSSMNPFHDEMNKLLN